MTFCTASCSVIHVPRRRCDSLCATEAQRRTDVAKVQNSLGQRPLRWSRGPQPALTVRILVEAPFVVE